MNLEIKKLKQFMDESKKIVFFGGAGVSTESGIPDFRSKDGLYNNKDVNFARYEPEDLLSRECLYNNPTVFYEFYRQKMDTRNVKPNITHYKLAELEQQGKLLCVITQNIDGLHQKAGSKTVYEIHGTTQRNYCVKCKQEVSSDFIFKSTDKIPKCPHCGRPIRPDVTLYGENLPNQALENAINALNQADMLIIGGTSLSVYPAANLIYDFHGEHLVVINREPLENKQILNPSSDLMIVANLGDIFSQL